VIIGFLFLTTGFLLQIVGRWDSDLLTLAACAGIILFAAAVYAIGAYSSKRAFKKLVREFFQSRPSWNFGEDMALTKEIGEILGVPHSRDMTVEAYVHQVRQAAGITAPQVKPTTLADRARRIALPVSTASFTAFAIASSMGLPASKASTIRSSLLFDFILTPR